jgi:hypothetical protein
MKVFNTASAFYHGFARERVKKHFLILKVSMGNITLYCRQHIACDV